MDVGCGWVGDGLTVGDVPVRKSVRAGNGVTVGADAVHLVATRVVAMASTVTACESEKRHRSHAGGTQNHTEYVEVHLSAHVVRGSLQQGADPRIL